MLASVLLPIRSYAQTLEGIGDLAICSVQLAMQGDTTAPVLEALQGALRSGDMLAISEALMDRVYPAAAAYCSPTAADLFRETAITQLLGAGASAQMSFQAEQFLRDLRQRGLAQSARAGRLHILLALNAEPAGRIPDAFRDVREALAAFRQSAPDSTSRSQAEEFLRCLQKDVAAGTTGCGADTVTDGPYGLTPVASFCARRNEMVSAAQGAFAAFGRPSSHAITELCDDEGRLRGLIAQTRQAPTPGAGSEAVVDSLLQMAEPIDRLMHGNKVARAQFSDLAAAYAADTARAARGAGDVALADRLQSRAQAIADDTAPLRREAAEQLPRGYKGWLPIDPWGPHLLALMLETHVPRSVFAQEAFSVMAAAKFDETSLRFRALAARGSSGTPSASDGIAAAQAALGPHEAMLAVRLTPAGTGVSLLVRHDRVALFPIALTQAATANLVNAYRHRLASPETDGDGFDPTEGVRLYRAVFGPLDAVHALDQISELFLVPDRTIESIPAAALITQVQGEADPGGVSRMAPVSLNSLDSIAFLRDRVAVTMLPSLEDLAALRHAAPVKAAQPYAGLGDPVGPAVGPQRAGRDWPLIELSWTAGQVKASQQRFRGESGGVLTGADATLENLLQVLRHGPFDVIELATHAVSQRLQDAPAGVPDPPWLLISPPAGSASDRPDLAGSFLTLREIAALPMDANLVILSACQTAGPAQIDGEGMLSGLSRAFISAGARSLIVTYWDAPYPAITQIMPRITAAMAADANLSAARAIADATRDYEQKASGLGRLPYFWASLGAVGPRPARPLTPP